MIIDGHARELIDQAVAIVADDQPYASLLTWVECEDMKGVAYQPDTYVMLYGSEAVKGISLDQLCNIISNVTSHIGAPCAELSVLTSKLIH